MKALISTVNQILLVDLETTESEIIENHQPEYYGISWWEDSEYPVMGHSNLKSSNLNTFKDYAMSEVGYLSFGKKCTTPFLSAPHQILCAPNGWVITTNTGRNRVTIYSPETGFYKDLKINSINWDRIGSDKCGEHFNSVFIKDNRLYVLAHGFNKTSHILTYSFPECELLERYNIPYRTSLHNIWIDDLGNIISCHSLSGELIEIKTNEVMWSGSASFTRGLAATKDLIIIGDSDLAVRNERDQVGCGLWIIDRKSLKTLDYLSLGQYGVCHEVRLLDIPDEAHHNIPFKNIDTLKQSFLVNNVVKKNIPTTSRIRREEKLRLLKSFENISFSTEINFIIGGIELNENGWLAPRYEYIQQRCIIAIAKKNVEDNYVISTEYAFFDSDKYIEQHFSIITGYKGNNDANMIAIFLHYTAEKNTHLYLWKNENGIWEEAELLIPITAPQGKLKVCRKGNILQITCNGSEIIEKEFHSSELEGKVGIRYQGANFRNFYVTN